MLVNFAGSGALSVEILATSTRTPDRVPRGDQRATLSAQPGAPLAMPSALTKCVTLSPHDPLQRVVCRAETITQRRRNSPKEKSRCASSPPRRKRATMEQRVVRENGSATGSMRPRSEKPVGSHWFPRRARRKSSETRGKSLIMWVIQPSEPVVVGIGGRTARGRGKSAAIRIGNRCEVKMGRLA
jgi:hypothetical protein